MLCKEQGFLLPVLLLALVPVRRQLFPDSSQRKAEHQAILLAFALVIWSAGGLIVLREEILKLRFEWSPGFLTVAIQPLAKSPPADRWLIPLALLGRYFQLLVAPLKLSIDYGAAVIGSTIGRYDPYLWLGAGVATTWAIASGVSLVRRRWVVSFCLLAMALTYFPASNIIMIATIFGERLMYLPSVFFVILIAVLLTRLRTTTGNMLLVTLLLLACLRTWTYVDRWNDRDSFYQYSLIQQPRSMAIHLLVADVDYEENKLSDARRITAEANSLYPDDWQMWKMSGLIDERLGDWPQAEADWKRRFRSLPHDGPERPMGPCDGHGKSGARDPSAAPVNHDLSRKQLPSRRRRVDRHLTQSVHDLGTDLRPRHSMTFQPSPCRFASQHSRQLRKQDCRESLP